MKKELFEEKNYAIVAPGDVNPLASSPDPLSAGRLPLNVTLIPREYLVTIPKTERMPEWQAVVLDCPSDGEVYLTSPRLLAAVGYYNGKLRHFITALSVCGKKSVMEFLASKTPIQVSKYQPEDQDVYNSDRTVKAIQAPKDVPWFVLATTPVVENTKKNNSKKQVTA